MAGKPNIRSIRFPDELAELIERQVGNSFTEKFENLIAQCVWELPQKEVELEQLEKKLRQLNQELYQRQEILNRLKSVTFDLCTKVYALGEAVDKEIKNWML
nr:hypothetical protein [uncultured Oscillibacter sp.]